MILEDQSPSARCPGCESAERRIAALEAQVAALTAALEESRRAGKRQAAPFRKGPPASQPKTPGRKPGDDYGTHARREAPADEELDEIINVPLPVTCPHCESCRVSETHVAQQLKSNSPPSRFSVASMCMSAVARTAASGCKDGMNGRRRMLWVPLPCNWEPGLTRRDRKSNV